MFISIRDVEHGSTPEVMPPWSFGFSETASDQINHVPVCPRSLKAPLQLGADTLSRSYSGAAPLRFSSD